ncbi:MAG: hypothetical protein KIS92_25520 [Planctomycetota bacterium]|nr:hypothetical protein [Planctomycetota bacterium]
MKKMYAALFALVLMAGVVRAETIDNPEYQNWSKFKAGTWVTYKQSTDVAGNKSVSETTIKLLEVTAEKCVLETGVKMEVAGQKIEQPAMKRDVPAKLEKVNTPVQQTETKDAPKPKEGTDTVTVSGNELKCKTVEVEYEAQGQKGTSKSWVSDDVPGMMVKSENKSAQMSMVMELVGFEKK